MFRIVSISLTDSSTDSGEEDVTPTSSAAATYTAISNSPTSLTLTAKHKKLKKKKKKRSREKEHLDDKHHKRKKVMNFDTKPLLVFLIFSF